MQRMLGALLPLTVSVHLLASVGVVPEFIGFDDVDAARAAAVVDAAVVATGHPAVTGPTLDDRCVEGECIVGAILGHPFSHLLRLSALRVGGEVETKETLYDRAGAIVVTASRVVPVAAFFTNSLSPQVTNALTALASKEPSPPTTTTTTTTMTTTTPSTDTPPQTTTAGAPVPIGLIVAGVSGAVMAIAVSGFFFEAWTLEQRDSAGADKDRARYTVWAALIAAVVGAGGVGAGVLLGVVPDDEPSKAQNGAAGSSWQLPE
jgi:hypothetical protein